MKAYLAIALVALLFNFAATASVGKTHLKPSSTEEVVVQEVADSNESLDDNVVDNDNSVLSNNVNDETVSNPVNLENVHNVPVHNVPEVSVVQNAPTKTLTHHVKPVVSTVNTVVNTVPVSTVNTVPVQNVVKTQVPRNNVVNVVKSVQAPQTQVVYSQVPQTQVVYSVVPQQQHHQVAQWQQPQTQVVYSVPQQQSVNVVPQQSVPQWQQQVTVQQVPQQQTVQQWQQPQQVVYTVPQQTVQQWQQPQQVVSVPQQTVQTVQQWQQPQQWQVVKNTVQPQVVRKNVVLEQTRPVQYATKTVVNKVVPNPIVYQVSPSKTVANRQWQQPSQQTVLTGAQLVSNVADESAKTDVIVQEVEQ